MKDVRERFIFGIAFFQIFRYPVGQKLIYFLISTIEGQNSIN